MTPDTQMIAPVVALAAWSMVIWAWMFATRLPAIRAANMTMDNTLPRGQQMSTLPARVRWKSDNYTNLMEQPTIFYAVAISLAVLGGGGDINATLAWAYVGLRVVHSLVQCLINKVELRFAMYILSNVPLVWLTVNAVGIALA